MQPGRIGPNAITRLAEALDVAVGPAACDALFAVAGLARYRSAPPTAMVDEREVMALHRALHARLPPALATSVARDAGVRTAEYLLANRIPRPVQAVLKLLPAPLAARVLLGTITRHAWTFIGTGQFHVRLGQPIALTIIDCPLARDTTAEAAACDYFAGTFERLFRALVHPATTVREVACAATGAPVCVFEVGWRGRAAQPIGGYSVSPQ